MTLRPDMNDELLSALLDGELSPLEQASVERALAESAQWRHAYDELKALRTSLQSLPRQKLDDDFANRVLRAAGLSAGSTLPASLAPAPQPATLAKSPWRMQPALLALASAAAVLVVALLVWPRGNNTPPVVAVNDQAAPQPQAIDTAKQPMAETAQVEKQPLVKAAAVDAAPHKEQERSAANIAGDLKRDATQTAEPAAKPDFNSFAAPAPASPPIRMRSNDLELALPVGNADESKLQVPGGPADAASPRMAKMARRQSASTDKIEAGVLRQSAQTEGLWSNEVDRVIRVSSRPDRRGEALAASLGKAEIELGFLPEAFRRKIEEDPSPAQPAAVVATAAKAPARELVYVEASAEQVEELLAEMKKSAVLANMAEVTNAAEATAYRAEFDGVMATSGGLELLGSAVELAADPQADAIAGKAGPANAPAPAAASIAADAASGAPAPAASRIAVPRASRSVDAAVGASAFGSALNLQPTVGRGYAYRLPLAQNREAHELKDRQLPGEGIARGAPGIAAAAGALDGDLPQNAASAPANRTGQVRVLIIFEPEPANAAVEQPTP